MNSTIPLNLTQCIPEDLQAQHPVGPLSHAALVAWLFLNISASQALLPILLIGLCCAKPRGELTLINIVIGWILYGIVASILLYSHHEVGCEPPPIVCLTQAALYMAIPPLICTLMHNALLQILFNLRQVLGKSSESSYHSVRKVALLLVPYTVYALFATAVAATGSKSPDTTLSRTRRFFYCSVRSSFLVDSIIGYCMTLLVLALILIGFIGFSLRQNWSKLRRSGKDGFDFGYFYRVVIYYLYTFIVLSLAFLPKDQLFLADFGMSTMGYATFIIFGSRSEPWQIYLRFLPRSVSIRQRRRKSTASDKMGMLSNV